MRSRPFIIMICGAAILCLTIGMGRSYGLFLTPITGDLGIGRSAFAFAIAAQNILWGLSQPFAGMISDRFGAAKVLIVGSILYLVGLATMSGATGTISLFFSAGLIVGLGISATSFSVVLGAVGRLVPPEKRSLALAVASTGGSFGQFMMIPVCQTLISAHGWSTALIVLGLIMALNLPLAFMLKGRAIDTPPASDDTFASPTEALTEAFRHKGYRYLTAGFFVCGFHVVFISTHLPAYLLDQGLPAKLGATAITVIGFFNIFGTYLWGLSAGRYRKKHLLSTLYFLRAIVITLFIALPVTEMSVLAFSAAIGLLWLGTVPLTSGLVAQIFGPRYMSTLFGVVFLSHQVGAFLGAWLAGFMFDASGSYTAVWVMAVILSLTATVLHMRINDQREPVLVPVPE